MAALFELGREALKTMAVEIGSYLVRRRWFHLGHAEVGPSGATVARLVGDVEREQSIELTGPFEGTETIAAAVWSGREFLGPERDDGIAKLRFGRRTLDLPMHVHSYSDRFIVVLDGEGYFHLSPEPAGAFTGRDVRAIRVRCGNVLMFMRGLVHTFSAPVQDLVLLSHHSLLIPCDDPRQYTVSAEHWRPRPTS